jgi:hypothetical protein
MFPGIPAAGSPAAPGGHGAAGIVLRAAVFIDGFNLYHAIKELGEPHLKWVNLYALSERLIRQNETLVQVVWCTAAHKNPSKQLRWREFRKAVEHFGVTTMVGHFTEEKRTCDRGHIYDQPTEKEGDVNLAIALISDAHLDKYDVAYLVTADSDQLATVKMFNLRFPNKRIISVAPPGRPHSKAIIQHSHGNKAIKRDTIAQCLLPGPTIIVDGTLIASRPPNYAPPA